MIQQQIMGQQWSSSSASGTSGQQPSLLQSGIMPGQQTQFPNSISGQHPGHFPRQQLVIHGPPSGTIGQQQNQQPLVFPGPTPSSSGHVGSQNITQYATLQTVTLPTGQQVYQMVPVQNIGIQNLPQNQPANPLSAMTPLPFAATQQQSPVTDITESPETKRVTAQFLLAY